MELVCKLKRPTRIQPEVMPPPGMAGVYTNQMHFIKKHLLDELTKKKFAQDFLHPVDTEVLQIPDYYQVIKHPMDLGTIIKRVENNYYQDVGGVIQDFELIITNCRQFNRENSSVYRKGIQLEKFFQRVMGNLPQGPPVPCNKDPASTIKPINSKNSMETEMEKACREQLRRLQAFTNQAEATARNFFAPKWESFAKKLDKQVFKSLEEFRSQVDGIFRKYHDPAKMIYEKAYDQPGGYGGVPLTSLPNLNVEELIGMIEMTENSLKQCVRQPQRGKSVLETFCATVAQFKLKLEDIQSALADQESPHDRDVNQVIAKPEASAASLCLPDEREDVVKYAGDGDISDDDDVEVEVIDEAEQRDIQKQFVKLPQREMREILALVDQNEGITIDEKDKVSYDLRNFRPLSTQMMKLAVNRAMKIANKLNLRDMQPEEKEGLRCSLETQLTDITERLSQSRRKNAAPLTSDKNKKNMAKNNGGQKRGRKRAKSRSPSPQPGPGPSTSIGYIPPAKMAISAITPIKATPRPPTWGQGAAMPGGKKGRGSLKPGFQGGRFPITPIGKGGRCPVTPGFPGGRVIVKPGPKGARCPVTPGRKGGRKGARVPITPGLKVGRVVARPGRCPITPGRKGTRCPVTPGLKVGRGPHGRPLKGFKTPKAAGKSKANVGPKKHGDYRVPVAPSVPIKGLGAGKPESYARFLAQNLDDSSDEDVRDKKKKAKKSKKGKKLTKKQKKMIATPGNVLNVDLSMSSDSSSSGSSSDSD